MLGQLPVGVTAFSQTDVDGHETITYYDARRRTVYNLPGHGWVVEDIGHLVPLQAPVTTTPGPLPTMGEGTYIAKYAWGDVPGYVIPDGRGGQYWWRADKSYQGYWAPGAYYDDPAQGIHQMLVDSGTVPPSSMAVTFDENLSQKIVTLNAGVLRAIGYNVGEGTAAQVPVSVIQQGSRAVYDYIGRTQAQVVQSHPGETFMTQLTRIIIPAIGAVLTFAVGGVLLSGLSAVEAAGVGAGEAAGVGLEAGTEIAGGALEIGGEIGAAGAGGADVMSSAAAESLSGALLAESPGLDVGVADSIASQAVAATADVTGDSSFFGSIVNDARGLLQATSPYREVASTALRLAQSIAGAGQPATTRDPVTGAVVTRVPLPVSTTRSLPYDLHLPGGAVIPAGTPLLAGSTIPVGSSMAPAVSSVLGDLGGISPWMILGGIGLLVLSRR